MSNQEIADLIKEKYNGKDILYLTQSNGRYISSWLNIMRDDLGCITFKSRSRDREIRFIPSQLNIQALEERIDRYSSGNTYVERFEKLLKERNIFRDMNTGYSLLETFVGAGGSHIGFMKENFRSLYVNDFVKECLQTLEYNNSNLKEEGTVFDNTPIEEIDSHQLINQLQLQTKELDVMFGV